MAEGAWLSRKQRKTFHQLRLRRENYGELVQIDGSEHRWFEDRAEPCTLLVFVDDATSKLMQLRFVASESTESYFAALRGYLHEHGCPVAFYSDKHSVFRVVRQDTKGGQLTFHYDRKQIILEQTEVAKGLEGQYVELFDYWNKPLEVRWRGHVLPYRIFSKDQRVSHTAIVENKRLGHALAIVKAQQDLRLTMKVMTNSEETGYRKRIKPISEPQFASTLS